MYCRPPTFCEINLSPFGKKKAEDFYARKNIAIFDLPVTQNEPIFSILTSPNSTEITKLVLNDNTSKCYLL